LRHFWNSLLHIDGFFHRQNSVTVALESFKGVNSINKFCAFRWPIATLLTAIVAAVLFFTKIDRGLVADLVRNGDWYTSKSVGSIHADATTRAMIAISGLLASTQQDSMYYRLKSVSGQPLSLNCRYRIEGSEYEANWWSITVYGPDYFLIPNQEKRYSYNNENIARDDNGQWVIHMSTHKETGNWLPVGASVTDVDHQNSNHDFDLLLRLYTPGDTYLQNPESAPLPTVTREECS
jgi:hypothetical protein